jgi:hypothetical protein
VVESLTGSHLIMKKYQKQALSQFNIEFSVDRSSSEAIRKCEIDGLVAKTKLVECDYAMGTVMWQFYNLTPKGLRYLADLLENCDN